jgi:hypothetical protein
MKAVVSILKAGAWMVLKLINCYYTICHMKVKFYNLPSVSGA